MPLDLWKLDLSYYLTETEIENRISKFQIKFVYKVFRNFIKISYAVQNRGRLALSLFLKLFMKYVFWLFLLTTFMVVQRISKR